MVKFSLSRQFILFRLLRVGTQSVSLITPTGRRVYSSRCQREEAVRVAKTSEPMEQQTVGFVGEV